MGAQVTRQREARRLGRGLGRPAAEPLGSLLARVREAPWRFAVGLLPALEVAVLMQSRLFKVGL